MTAARIDFAALMCETRGYEGVTSGTPVPRSSLVAQARANGYNDHEIREALRVTNTVVAAPDADPTADNPAVVLASELDGDAEGDEQGDDETATATDADTSGGETANFPLAPTESQLNSNETDVIVETADDRPHDNPIGVSDVTDAERAVMLKEYLDHFEAEFGMTPRLMPLNDEGKTPIIQGRTGLDTPEALSYLVDGREAVRQIREFGVRGFAIYAGKTEHNTEDLLLVDVDDRSTFPYEAFGRTLYVMAGSGRGEHMSFRNSGNVQNAAGKDGVDGEVRAHNWFCVTPGSVHPSGGVYHIIDDREIATLTADDIPRALQPGSARRPATAAGAGGVGGDTDTDTDAGVDANAHPDPADVAAKLPDDETITDRLERAFENPHDGERMEHVYNGRYAAAGFDDRSSAEFWFANRVDSWVGFGDRSTVEAVMDNATLHKWSGRGASYRNATLKNVGRQDRYYNPDGFGGAGTPAPGGHAIEKCDPPDDDAEVLDVDARREELAGERFDAYLADDATHLWRDPQGTGKTTNATLGAEDRGLVHTLFVERHKKARGHVLDDVTPDDYSHLKGSNQKHNGTCMDADHNDEECWVHGDTGCPHMCPVYDLSPDHAVRKEYEHLVVEVGPQKAHELLADRLADHGHDDNAACPWTHGFKEAEKAENVVGVHEHQTLRSATHKEGTPRVPIVDEHPELGDMYGRDLGVEQLITAAHALESPGYDGVAGARNEFARFANRLVTKLTTPSPTDDTDEGAGEDADSEPTNADTDVNANTNLFADVDPPNVAEYAETETVVVEDFGPETTDDDLPNGVTTADVFETTDTEREYQNPAEPQEGYREREVTRYFFERPAIREVLAEVKLAYNRRVLARMRDGDWNGEPFAFDTLLAAAAEAGLDAYAARQAIALPNDLGDETCPRCHGHLIQRNGAGVCATDNGCGWSEATDPILAPDAPKARAIASLIRRDDPTGEGDDGARLSSTILPHPDELPTNPLVLDATGSPTVVGATYGVDPEDVVVSGDTTPEMPNFHVTQVLDGQYHWSTLNNDDSTSFDRMMDAVEQTAPLHEKVLAVGPKALAAKVADERGGFPENVDFAHYHAVKGENAYKDHDTVCILGAPPVRVDGPGGLREQARLLAQGDHAEGIEVGGVEHSTRRGTADPIRRKLRFEDDDGTGRGIPTKGYTGLVGDLYAIHHEREIEQAVHRIRPVNATAETPKCAYLFTNTPTDLPVDEAVSLDELSASPAALLPVCENALTLAEALADVAADGDAGTPDGFRARSFVTRDRDGDLAFNIREVHAFARREAGLDVSERTVRRYVEQLTNLGLLRPGEYEQRRGRVYDADQATLTRALSVLTNNANVEVAQKRRIAALAAKSRSAAAWLRAASDLFDLRGDRCTLGGPPSNADGGGGHAPPPA